jgi:thymidylate synthase
MNVNELNKNKAPIVRIDNSLGKYKDMHLFQHKVDEANEMLRKVGLPKPELMINHPAD